MKRLRLGNLSYVLLCLFLIAEAANSRLIAEILPEKGQNPLELYNDELGRYEIRITNADQEDVSNLFVKIVASGNLAIIKGLEETKEVFFSLGPLKAGAEKSVLIKVKPVDKVEKEGVSNAITVYFGSGEYTQFVGTYVKVLEPPVNVKASLEKYLMASNEDNKAEVEIENVSAVDGIQNIFISLQLPEKFNAREQSYKVSALKLGESIKKSFSFEAAPDSTGQHYLAIVVEFTDSKGAHAIEKNFKLEVQGIKLGTTIAIALIIGLIVAYLVLKNEKKHEAKDSEQKQKG